MSRRRTIWEDGASVDDAINVDFRSKSGELDLRPSVYVFEVAAHDVHSAVVRLRAEHSFSFAKPPNAGATQIDLEGATARPIEQSVGGSRFEFANTHHHEILLEGESDLKELVQAVHAGFQEREHAVQRDEVLTYAANREDAGDAEWAALLADPEKKEWSKLVAKQRDAKGRSS